jgi:PKD repeat protein
MRNKTIFYFSFYCLLLLVMAVPVGVRGQCGANTTSGANCTRSSVYYGEVVPNAGCGNYVNVVNYSPGTHFRIPVLLGGCYTVSTCGAPINTQVAAFQGNATTGPFSYNDDNGPECAGTAASITMVPNFTDYARVDVRQSSCSAGGTSSITVQVRQNNNLVITSSGAAMCAGQSRSLTATPATVGTAPQPNSGNVGAFSGTGVSGTIFTAPQPSASMQTYNITYNFGFCSTTQGIDVYRAPSIANAGANFSVCSGTATMGGNSPTYGTGTWTILSGPGTITTPSQFNTTVTGLVTGSTTVLRWVIANGPCGFTADTVSVFREFLPTTASASPDQDLCVQSTSVTGNAPTVGVGLWYLLGGSGTIVTPGGPNTNITAIGSGVNTFVWSITNGVCPPSNDTVVITRDVPPTPAFAGPDIAMCDSVINLNANIPVLGSGLWSIISGSGNIATPTNPNSQLSNVPIGTTTLAWAITNGVCPPSIDTVVVLRNNAPAPPTVTGNVNVCENSQTLLTASSGVGSPQFKWWDAPVGGTLLASTASYSTPPVTGNVTYYVEVTDASTSCASDRVPVTITMVPAPVLSLGPDRFVCDNDTSCFNAPQGLNSYIWSTGGITSSECTPDSGMMWVQVTDFNNCISRDTAFIFFVTTLPISLGNDTAFCAGGTVTLGNFTGNNTYVWSTTATTSSISVGTSGTYSVTVTDVGGCQGVDTIVVTQFPAVQSSFTVDTSFCPQIVFVDNSVGASAWSWTFGDGDTSTFWSPIHIYTGNGTYTVTLTVTGLCGTDVTTQTVPVNCLVGLDLPSSLAITVYPNPNNGSFKVRFQGLETDAEIAIYNELGQEVFAKRVRGTGDVEEAVQLKRPAAGTYFMKLKLGDATVMKKVLVR